MLCANDREERKGNHENQEDRARGRHGGAARLGGHCTCRLRRKERRGRHPRKPDPGARPGEEPRRRVPERGHRKRRDGRARPVRHRREGTHEGVLRRLRLSHRRRDGRGRHRQGHHHAHLQELPGLRGRHHRGGPEFRRRDRVRREHHGSRQRDPGTRGRSAGSSPTRRKATRGTSRPKASRRSTPSCSRTSRRFTATTDSGPHDVVRALLAFRGLPNDYRTGDL